MKIVHRRPVAARLVPGRECRTGRGALAAEKHLQKNAKKLLILHSGFIIREGTMKTVNRILAVFLVLGMVGCATATNFKLPRDTEIQIADREQAFKSGEVKISPFGWKASSGIDYSLVRKGKVVKTGKLPAKFRIVSIFWIPVYSIIAQPMGFGYDCYDLTKGDVKHCTLETQKTK